MVPMRVPQFLFFFCQDLQPFLLLMLSVALLDIHMVVVEDVQIPEEVDLVVNLISWEKEPDILEHFLQFLFIELLKKQFIQVQLPFLLFVLVLGIFPTNEVVLRL